MARNLGSRLWQRLVLATVIAMLAVPIVAGTALANVGTVTIGTQTPTAVVPGNQAQFNVQVTATGTTARYFAATQIRNAPTGVTYVSSTCVRIVGGASGTVVLTVGTTTASTTGTFQVRVRDYDTAGCTNNQNSSNWSGDGTITFIAATTTSLISSANPSVPGQAVTFTATVTGGTTTPTGTIQFRDNGVALGSPVTLNAGGTASYVTSALTLGTHPITAAYSGDTTHATSTGAVSQVVSLVSTTTTLISSANPSTNGQSVTFTATVTGGTTTPTGTVQFRDNGVALGSPVTLNAGGTASYVTISLTAGTHPITAVYSGDTTHATSTGAVSQVVNAAGTTTVVVSALNPSVLGDSVTFTATVTGGTATPTGTVQFRDNGTGIGSAVALDGSGVATYTTSSLALGSHPITAVYSGDASHTTSTSAAVNQLVSVRLTFYAVLCPNYGLAYRNERYNQTPPADHTGGHANELASGFESADANPATQIPGACTLESGWQYNVYTNYDYNTGTGDSLGSYTTGSGGTVSIVLNATQLAAARANDGSTALWVTQTDQPYHAGFAGLRCYTNVYYSDNQETIYNASTANIYCIGYDVQTLSLTKSANPTTYNHAGQTIIYTYTLRNTGTPTTGTLGIPYTVTDDKATVTCPATPTTLAYNATVQCTATYTITNADMVAGSVKNTATATAMWGSHQILSNQATATITGAAPSPSLTIDKTASQYTYSQLGTSITYSYLVTNNGNVDLSGVGVVDNVIPTVSCPKTTLVVGESMTCTAVYLTPDANSVTNTATASGTSGATTVQVTDVVTITRATLTITASSPSITYGDPIPAITPSYSGFLHGETATPTPPTCSANPVTLVTTCSGAVDPNYTIVYVPGAVTVGKANLVITASSPTIDYGDPIPAITPSYGGLVNGDTAPATLPTCSADPVTLVTSCSGAADPNYNISYLPGAVTVNAVPLVITASSASMTYGDPLPTITPSYNGLVNGDTAPATPPTCVADPATHSTNCSGAADPHYNISYLPGTLSVTPVNLVITASDVDWTYGAPAPAVSPSYSGLVNGDTAPATEPTCSADLVALVTSCSGAVDPNYNISYVPGTVTFHRASLLITASSPSITYGDSIPAITPSYNGLVNGDTAPATEPTCSADPVTLVTSCSGAADPNYDISYLPGIVTVGPAPLTITASSPTIDYGDPIPAITASYTGLVNGDTAPATLPTCVADPVTLVTSCSGAVDPHYTIGYVPGAVTVNPVNLVITASSASMTYGDPLPTITPSYNGLVNGDTAPATLPTCVADLATNSTNCSGAADPHYNISYLPGTLSVTPVNLVITASDVDWNYGDPAPAVSPQYSGLVNGDTAPATPPTCSADLATLVTSCSDAADPHYNISYVPGVVTVHPVNLVITASSPTVQYGDPIPAITASYSGLANGDTAPATPPTCVADPVTLVTSCSGAVDPHYNISYLPGAVTVTPRDLIVTADDQSRPYGESNPTFTFTLALPGFVNGDHWLTAPTCNSTATATSPVGNSYAITCTGGVVSGGSYNIIYNPGRLTITAWTITVQPDPQTITLGDPIPTLTFTMSGFMPGDDESVVDPDPTCSTTASQGDGPGTFPITCAGGTAPAYYTFAYGTANLTVQAPALSITKSAGTAHFDHAGQVITYTYRVINTGNAAFSSATQFQISDDRIDSGAWTDCGAPAALTPNTGTLTSPSAGSFVTCTRAYTITQTDLDNGSVTNSVGGRGGSINTDDPATVTITAVGPEITLVKAANVETWTKVGDVITYTYTITNTGSTVVSGPFSVTDDKIASVTCPSSPASLAHGESIVCTATYTTVEADLNHTVTNVAQAFAGNTPSLPSRSVTLDVPFETVQDVTSPPTSTTPGPEAPANIPLFALLICIAFSVLGLMGFQVQRKSIRR